MRSLRATVLFETVLVFIPFFLLSVGLTEYLWYLNMKTTLTSTADAAVHFAATDHYDLEDKMAGNPKSLDHLRAGADAAARAHLTAMGFSESFISSVTVQIDYIDVFAATNPRYEAKGVPQKEGRKLVGAEVSIPIENAMIFGNFAVKFLQITTELPTELSLVVFMWKNWKKEN